MTERQAEIAAADSGARPGLQAAKALVRSFHAALDASPAAPGAAIAAFCTRQMVWRGYHPFNELSGAEAAERFWMPLRVAFTAMQRREDVFFAGLNEIDGFTSTWVVSMGHLVGLFDRPWLGIPPTRKLTCLRYCAFYRVDGDRIAETTMYFDIPQVMEQAGLRPFPVQTGAQGMQPGPRTHDGLLLAPCPEAEGRATLALVNRMISDLGQWQSPLPLEEELRLTWAEDMAWYGPTGIGATYTIPRYAEQHSRPFRAAFTERARTGHIARLAEGHYAGFFGWPNFTARHVGGFMGMPGGGQVGAFRVIDIYRRDGDKLSENWVFIDLLHFWKTQGVDILERTTGIAGR